MDDDGSTASGNTSPPSGQATIDAPELNTAGTALKLEAKSVKNAAQAYNICKGLEYNNRHRALRTADVQAMHDGKPPRGPGENMEKGKAWQANASTLWMAGIVGRVAQRMVNAVISQVYVTASSMPDNYLDAKSKTDSLRAGFTTLVRGWDGNTGFINAVAVETVLQGYCYAVFLDPHTWQPTFFKQDELFVPEKSGQHARELQFFCAKRDFRIDQFLELFADEKAAETVGFDLHNCLEAASKAVMKDPRDDATTTQFRKFEDMINEGAIGIAVTGSGERIVKTWMLFNREYDGKVSFWLLERDTGKKLRFSFKLFTRMQDLMAMFSFEAGNGCIHSSKGLGRKLAALATMKEIFRCGIIDNSRMGGMMVISVDAANKSKFAPQMMSPFILVDKSVDLKGAQQFQVSAEAYKVVDLLIDSWAEQAVGAYLTAQINDKGKTERTATEANIDSRRENEAADVMIRRYLDQSSNPIQMQQLRVCSDDNLRTARRIYRKMVAQVEAKPEDLFPDDIDDTALLRFLVKKMEEGLTDDEIQTWSKSPSSAFAHVTEGAVQQGVSVVAKEYAANPNVDQGQLAYLDIEGKVGANVAKQIFIPRANETLAIESARKQMQETFVMSGSGQPIPVSPRDNHMGEIPTVIEFLTNAVAPQLSKADAQPAIMKAAGLNLNHLGEHLAFAAQDAITNKMPAFKEAEKFFEGFKKQLGQVVQIQQEAAVAHAAVMQKVRAEGLPPDAVSSVGADTAPANVIPGDFNNPVASETQVPTLAGV